MADQTKDYISIFDVSLVPSEELQEKINSIPEISFDEINESGDLDLIIASIPRP
jgi:hypothetical protein